MIRVTPIACLSDNYAYVVACTDTGEGAIVDASEARPVLTGLLSLPRVVVGQIWSTHHHPDHVGGNEEVAGALGGASIFGHESDRGRIPGQTKYLREGDQFKLGELSVRALHIPGHTTGAVAYVVSGPGATADVVETVVFTGDTMFLAGCGRLFEGTPEMMHESLRKLAELPLDTRVYCGHEYTLQNLKFAVHCEPSNADVAARLSWAEGERAAGRPTVPGTIGDELKTNPFLRCHSPELRERLNIPEAVDDATALGAVRAAKDTFR